MKKIIQFLLLLLLILTGCSNSETTIDNTNDSEQEIKEIQPIDIEIWGVEPKYLFDDIDVPFTCLNNDYRSFSNDPCRYNGHKVYDYYDEGGLLVINNSNCGIINGEGTICVPTMYNEYHTTGLRDNPVFLTGGITETAQDVTHNYQLIDTDDDAWGVGGAPVYPCGISLDGEPIVFYFNAYYEPNDGVIKEERSTYNPIDKAIQNGYIDEDDYIIMKTGMWFLTDEEIEEVKKEINNSISGYLLINKEEYHKLEIDADTYHLKNFSDDILLFYRYDGWNNEDGSEIVNDFTYINLERKTIASGYSNAYGFYEGYAAVCKDNKWGYIDKKGNVVIDFIFDKATPISEGKAWVIYKGRTGRLNILDMLNNNVPFTDETLNVESYTQLPQIKILADNIKIRKEPSINGEHITKVIKDQIFHYTNKKETDGYTWYEIARDMWIADKNGEWIIEQ